MWGGMGVLVAGDKVGGMVGWGWGLQGVEQRYSNEAYCRPVQRLVLLLGFQQWLRQRLSHCHWPAASTPVSSRSPPTQCASQCCSPLRHLPACLPPPRACSGQTPQHPLPDSRDASVRGGRTRSNDSSVRAGRQYWEPSVRAGKAYLEPSVRAGRAFYGASSSGPGEYSVRGGTANLPPGIDSSMRGGGASGPSPFAATATAAGPTAAAPSGGSVAAAPQYNAHTSPRPSMDEGPGAQQQLGRKSLEEELVPIRVSAGIGSPLAKAAG